MIDYKLFLIEKDSNKQITDDSVTITFQKTDEKHGTYEPVGDVDVVVQRIDIDTVAFTAIDEVVEADAEQIELKLEGGSNNG